MLTQELIPLLVRRRGQIVFINSTAGFTARANIGQYAATKHGLRAIADSLRDEINGAGVRVLTVYPGRTATPTQERLHALEGKTYRPDRLLQPEDVASVVVHALCLPRTAEVTEIRISSHDQVLLVCVVAPPRVTGRSSFMKVVLFCGGLGTRIGEYPEPSEANDHDRLPSHLVACHEYYAHHGHKDFVLCLGYKADVVKNYFLNYDECVSNNFTLSNGGKETPVDEQRYP